MCGRNFSDNSNVVVREINSGTVQSDPLEKKGTGRTQPSESCAKNRKLCTNEVDMPHARVM
jgi:hypothetical protein